MVLDSVKVLTALRLALLVRMLPVYIYMLAAIACSLGLDLFHHDVEQAFVQSDLDVVVYVRLPRHYGALFGRVVRLARSLSDLKQASRTWQQRLVIVMESRGFEQCLADTCVMRLVTNGSLEMAVVVHVDNIFAVGAKARWERFCQDVNAFSGEVPRGLAHVRGIVFLVIRSPEV